MRPPIARHSLTVAGGMVLALVGLAGCGPPPEPPVVSVRRPAPAPRPAPPAPDPQLGALPVPAAVLDALPRGRRDPFAPPPPAAPPPATAPTSRAPAPVVPPSPGSSPAAVPTPPALPTVHLTGVALVNGQALAFVSHNGDSGPVAVGDRGGVGGSRKPWLPRDWAVQAIDVGAGALRLQGPPPRSAGLTVRL